MKILHLIYDDIKNPWLGGGGAIRIYEINKRLAEKHQVTVLTGSFPATPPQVDRDSVLYRRVGWGKTYVASRLSYMLGVAKVAKQLEYDLLVEEFSPFSPCFSPLWAKCAVIGSVQSQFGVHAIRKHKLLGIPAFMVERFGLSIYRDFITVSPYLQHQLTHRYGDTIRTVNLPNAPDQSLFACEPQETPFILFLGRIDIWEKGLDLLMEAYARLMPTPVRLRIAGTGKTPEQRKLTHLIRKWNLGEWVDQVGKITGDEKRKAISQCLFMVMPSRYEGFSISALEAAACQKPVIANGVPGLSYQVKHNHTGLLFQRNNVTALTEAMQYLLANKGKRKELGWNARQWAEDFTWDGIAQAQERFYYDVYQCPRNATTTMG